MQCKIFSHTSRARLEEVLNQWLENNPILPGCLCATYGTINCDPARGIVEHVIVLFYVPLVTLD